MRGPFDNPLSDGDEESEDIERPNEFSIYVTSPPTSVKKDEPYFLSAALTTQNSPSPSRNNKTKTNFANISRSSGHHGRLRNGSGDDDEYPITTPSNFTTRKYQKRQFFILPSTHTRRLILCFQIASVLVCAVCLYTLVDNVIDLWKTEDGIHTSAHSNSTLGEDLRRHWIVENLIGDNEAPYSRSLLDLKNFYFVLNNASMCRSDSDLEKTTLNQHHSQHHHLGEGLGGGIYFMVIIHSAPHNFESRQAIRSTWGSIKTLKNVSIRLVFLLGRDPQVFQTPTHNSVEKAVIHESELYGDIVSGDFMDTYRNLTYKHLMGYKWVLNFCPGAKFVLKTDDDAFVDLIQLQEFISSTFGLETRDTLICNVFPEGTKPVRENDHLDKKDGTVKWAVTEEEYPHEIYPKYCGGLAYLATPDILSRIYKISQNIRFFWIDDIFTTGLLREFANIEPFYMNLRYSYEPEEYRKWLEDRNPTHKFRKIPFMIVHVERGQKFSEEMNRLWRKTMRAWS